MTLCMKIEIVSRLEYDSLNKGKVTASSVQAFMLVVCEMGDLHCFRLHSVGELDLVDRNRLDGSDECRLGLD